MTVALALQVLEALAATVTQVAPLVAQGQSVMSADDAAQIHAALQKAEAATAALRSQVDAALEAAAAKG